MLLRAMLVQRERVWVEKQKKSVCVYTRYCELQEGGRHTCSVLQNSIHNSAATLHGLSLSVPQISPHLAQDVWQRRPLLGSAR